MAAALPEATRLADAFGRRFPYLRLSITEVCNFRCTYCLPDGFRRSGPLSFLTPVEIGRLVDAFAELGVCKVRLTGGEPTVRKDLTEIVARVSSAPGVRTVAMTTNGWNLHRHIKTWHAAGLNHLNVSVDDLDPRQFAAITGHDRLPEVLAGIDAALALGLPTIKINAVLLGSSAEAGFARFAEFVKERPIAVRFIELMRTADNRAFFDANHVSGSLLRRWLEERDWSSAARRFDDGPATEFVHSGHAGRLGLIAPYSPGFCEGCNRLRVTARGRLRLCLFGEGGIDLRALLQSDAREPLVDRIVEALGQKRAGHRLRDGDFGDTRHLAQLGG